MLRKANASTVDSRPGHDNGDAARWIRHSPGAAGAGDKRASRSFPQSQGTRR